MQDKINKLMAQISELQDKLNLVLIEVKAIQCPTGCDGCGLGLGCLYQRLIKILKDI